MKALISFHPNSSMNFQIAVEYTFKIVEVCSPYECFFLSSIWLVFGRFYHDWTWQGQEDTHQPFCWPFLVDNNILALDGKLQQTCWTWYRLPYDNNIPNAGSLKTNSSGTNWQISLSSLKILTSPSLFADIAEIRLCPSVRERFWASCTRRPISHEMDLLSSSFQAFSTCHVHQINFGLQLFAAQKAS